MNLDSLRAYCLSFPGATEGLQWGECLLFRVANKIFVELLEIEGIHRAPYIGKHDWVELERMDLLRDDEMRELIAESYDNIRSKLPRRVQEKLEGKKKQVPRRGKTRLGITKKKKSTRQSPS